MKKFIIILGFFLISCGANKDNNNENITKTEQKVIENNNSTQNYNTGHEMSNKKYSTGNEMINKETEIKNVEAEFQADLDALLKDPIN